MVSSPCSRLNEPAPPVSSSAHQPQAIFALDRGHFRQHELFQFRSTSPALRAQKIGPATCRAKSGEVVSVTGATGNLPESAATMVVKMSHDFPDGTFINKFRRGLWLITVSM